MRILLFAFVLAGAAFAQGKVIGEEEKNALVEFERFMASKDIATRLNQIEFMGKFDSVATATAIIEKGLRDSVEQVRMRASRVLGGFHDPSAIDAVIAGLKDKAPSVREGCARALTKLQNPKGLDAIGTLLPAEKDPGVTVAMLQAISGAKRSIAADAVAKHLANKDGALVQAAIDALGNSQDAKCAEYLNPLLRSKDWGVQTATIQAVGKLRAKSSIPFLIEIVASTKGRIATEARDTLVLVTGWEFGLEAKRWQDWWANLDPKWEVPKEIKKVDTVAEGYGQKTTKYHQITTTSKRIFFVIDVSASMNADIRFRDSDGKFQTGRKIDLAKEELIKTLKTLDENTDFGILAFEALLDPFKPSLVRANKGSIDEAIAWVRSLRLNGTDGNPILTEEGYQRGETNTFAALKWIYGKSGKEGTNGPVTTTGGTGMATPKLKPIADTVFLLSDGEPSCGEMTVTDDIIEKLTLYNQASRVIINTISFETIGIGRKFLADIAKITGGTAVVVGEGK